MRSGRMQARGVMVITVFLCGFGAWAQQQPAMLLCIDSTKQNNAHRTPYIKTVYGYIDGKRTDCMSETEFKSLFYKSEYERMRAALPDSEKLLEQKGLRHQAAVGSDPEEALYIGKNNLSGVNLSGADLQGVNFAAVNLEKANLNLADLRGANLKGADLRGASLESAYLKDANLDGADLTGANLKGAYFHHADLRNAKGLTIDNARFVRTFFNAALDTGLLMSIRAQTPNKFKDPGWGWDTDTLPGKQSKKK